jgi:preprotein translocase subunit SecD
MFLGRDVSTRLGLDLQGGTQVLLRAEQPGEVTREEMQTAAGVIERRVNALGVGETVVQLAGGNRIIVELPGVANPEQAIETLRGTGRLEFIDSRGQYLPEGQLVRTTNAPEIPEALLGTSETAPLTPTGMLTQTGALTPTGSVTTSDILPPVPGQTGLPGQAGQGATDETIYPSITDGADLDTNQVQPTSSQSPTGLNEPAVSFAFTGESASRLATFSAQNVGQPMCIVLDHRVVSCPRIQSPLTDGAGIITTNSPDDQKRIYNQLKFGALPVALQVETSRTVSATLGLESVNQSIIAGIVGLVVVALFMMLYYRLPGFLAVVALMIYTALNFAFYRIIPITLTLAGIAGFILSIGLAVDANVLIFARLKEELRKGKGLRTAIETGFEEAWSAIRDSSVSTLITSVILWIFGNSFGVSIIKGFAITLGLGIVLSLFTAVVITRTLLRLTVAAGFANNLWFFELSPSDLHRPGETVGEPEPETA